MDGIVALGHFCENHGPCIVLCTQCLEEEPSELNQGFQQSECEGCRLLQDDEVLSSRHGNICYVTTKIPLQSERAQMMKQAVIRSLTCEVQEASSKEDGMVYFGDNERGHVISHIFSLKDSQSRGFKRKYCIVVFMKQKLCLLNSWSHFTRAIKETSLDLQEKASIVYENETSKINPRAARESGNGDQITVRSLAEITEQPAISGHLHMWFTFMLSAEVFTTKEFKTPEPEHPVNCRPLVLKHYFNKMDTTTFRTIAYCILTSIKVEADSEIINAFMQLLPDKFLLPTTGEICKLTTIDGKWRIQWSGQLPKTLPNLLISIEKAFKNDSFPEDALESHVTSIVYQWYNRACALKWAPKHTTKLYNALGVQTQDMPLISYWMTQCNK